MRFDHRVLDRKSWTARAESLGAGEGVLSALWGEVDRVQMAVLDEANCEIEIVSLPCPRGNFPSLARHHRCALRLERSVTDLFGLIAEGTPDARPWLDHGKWSVRHPLSERPLMGFEPPAYAFLPADGESLHQVPVGPVHAGIIEPGHFRFTANGETVVRLEERLGYVHKGVELLMAGAKSRARRDARRPGLRRQHGGIWAGFRARC